jgi:hypothetical protein
VGPSHAPVFRKRPPRAAFCISDPPIEAGFLLAQQMKKIDWTKVAIAAIRGFAAIIVALINHSHSS